MFPPERSRPIWERWARYEYQFGNLQAAQNLEKRMAEAFPSGAVDYASSYFFSHVANMFCN